MLVSPLPLLPLRVIPATGGFCVCVKTDAIVRLSFVFARLNFRSFFSFSTSLVKEFHLLPFGDKALRAVVSSGTAARFSLFISAVFLTACGANNLAGPPSAPKKESFSSPAAGAAALTMTTSPRPPGWRKTTRLRFPIFYAQGDTFSQSKPPTRWGTKELSAGSLSWKRINPP